MDTELEAKSCPICAVPYIKHIGSNDLVPSCDCEQQVKRQDRPAKSNMLTPEVEHTLQTIILLAEKLLSDAKK